mgnify:CR=1 FL=1
MKDYSSLQNGSDIRGVALAVEGGKRVDLTLEAARDIGSAFGLWLAERTNRAPSSLRVAIGRDSRVTGEAISLALAEGLSAVGAGAYIAGLASTPAMFMCCVEGEAPYDGGIMVTASHLPMERNGAKFFTRESGLEKADIKAILSLASGDLPSSLNKGTILHCDVMTDYIAGLRRRILTALGLEDGAAPFEGMRIIVDAGNGAGGFFAERLLAPLGADITGSLYLEPDGTFPNHQPNPENAEAMKAITEAVVKTGADMGIIFDTDVDRAGAVLPDGNGGALALDRNRLIAMMTVILSREHGPITVVTDSITSTGLAEFIASLGCRHHRFKRGYRNVINEAKRLMAEGENAVFAMEGLNEQVVIPEIDMTYNEAGLNIEDSRIVLGNSDFSLKGALTNIYNHFKDDELLTGEFAFTSQFTDIDQLMDIFSGMGADTTTDMQTATAVTDTTAPADADPFMVPYGVNIKLHTLIDNAQVSETKLHNIGGDLTIKDGILVLEEIGFTSDAAEMQLTAIYKSKRRNHLYVGLDFHLLDIDIAEMIRIIPDLDTIVPMLKSFAGSAEFHFAAETNLKADYSLKYSTLKAACSIEGQDLVVLDNHTFNKIKKLLFFSKKTDNKIDSLDVQFTVFKNEIDVYPFSIGMDKYHAMLYGRHNLDMSYDYNIALLSPKLFNRLGIEIKGTDFDNTKFKVRRSRHRNMFNPEKRDYKEEKIAEIKKIISNSLKDNVK